MNTRFATILFAVAVLSSFPQLLNASHPFHVSSAEIDWNPKSGNFEVALCVWPADLEKAIAGQQGSPVDLDQVEDVDALMAQYVASQFAVLRDSKQQRYSPQPLRWVGHEMDLRKAWLYFEIPGDRQPGNWKVENRLFVELNEDQINQVQLSVGESPVSVSLNKNRPFVKFETSIKSAKWRR